MSGSWGCLKGGSCGWLGGRRVFVSGGDLARSLLTACPPNLVRAPLGFKLREQYQPSTTLEAQPYSALYLTPLDSSIATSRG
jgi:hypothetical protein